MVIGRSTARAVAAATVVAFAASLGVADAKPTLARRTAAHRPTLPTAAAPAASPVETALVHHRVSTLNVRAQQAFDEGLTLVYAFNRDEARKRFERAAALDPKLAIAWWGVALAVGPNLNFGIDSDRLATAHAAIARARALEGGASPEERALVDAVAVRYPATATAPTDPGYRAYRDAMRAVSTNFSTDDDAATLYAESVMDVDGWEWTNGVPSASASAIRTTLETVLKRNPGHVGANHYYVHLMDAEGVAPFGIASAERLSALHVEPAASHLIHMSGHIYLDVGRFADLERDNRTAVDDDRAYAATIGKSPTELDYYRHNLNFYTGGAVMLDDRVEQERALAFARQAGYVAAPLVDLRDGAYANVLAAPLPPASASAYDLALARYARAIAGAALGNPDAAQRELDAFDAASARHDAYDATPLRDLMRARIAHARGDDESATALLRTVVATTKRYPPEVFPVWSFPVGEWLGWIELHRGNAVAAESAFRDDLSRTPHNARALFGLMESIGHQGRTSEAGPLAYEIVKYWRGPYGDLRVGIP